MRSYYYSRLRLRRSRSTSSGEIPAKGFAIVRFGYHVQIRVGGLSGRDFCLFLGDMREALASRTLL